MIILQTKPKKNRPGNIVLVFGTGLIGTAICRSIDKQADCSSGYLPFGWENTERMKQESRCILEYLKAILAPTPPGEPETMVSVVWSAGTTGFFSSPQETEKEMTCFDNVLEFLCVLSDKFAKCKISFHLISSAGGIFEGCVLVDENTSPDPKRNYGYLKYEQEKKVFQLDERITRTIYRPTSVYGYIGEGFRSGLIGTLLANGMWNKISSIYGGLHTLRDYIFNGDVGDYVADRLLHDSSSDEATEIHHLGAAKPCSIQEIRHEVENVLGRKIYIQLVPDSETGNDLDITFSPSLFPDSWQPLDVKTGIYKVKESIFFQNSRKFSARPITVH